MNKERYVRYIVKKIEGSSQTKKAAKKQLLGEVTDAMEQGESLIDVIARMGSDDEVAKKWNDTLSEKERKQYKKCRLLKRIGTVIGILVLVCIACVWLFPRYYEIDLEGRYDKQEVEQQVRYVVEQLDREEYDALKQIATDSMKKVLNARMIESAKEEQTGKKDWGAFVKYGELHMSQMHYRGKIYAVTKITVEYESICVVYSIAFDDQMKFTKLSMEPAEEK